MLGWQWQTYQQWCLLCQGRWLDGVHLWTQFVSPTPSLSFFPSLWYNAWATTAAVCTKQVFLSVTFLPTPPDYHLHACAHVYLRVPTCGYSVVLAHATSMVSHVCWFACVCQKRPLRIPCLTVMRRHGSDVYLGMSQIQNGGSYLMY